jgi:hypothetical protein
MASQSHNPIASVKLAAHDAFVQLALNRVLEIVLCH